MLLRCIPGANSTVKALVVDSIILKFESTSGLVIAARVALYYFISLRRTLTEDDVGADERLEVVMGHGLV